MTLSDEARRLFAVVVNELWHKHPELVVPGWSRDTKDVWTFVRNGSEYDDPFRIDILAAAALCAENYDGNLCRQVSGVTHPPSKAGMWGVWDEEFDNLLSEHDCWCAAQFARTLAEKGIEHD